MPDGKGMKKAREILLHEGYLFDQRNGNPPSVERRRQLYPASVQGRLGQADSGVAAKPTLTRELAWVPCLPPISFKGSASF